MAETLESGGDVVTAAKVPPRVLRAVTARRETALPQIDLRQLPPLLRLMVRAMGERSGFELVKLRGGTLLTIPHSVKKGSSAYRLLVDLVGAPAADALVGAMPGRRVMLPKYDSVMRQLRHTRVVDLRNAGHRLMHIALATGYTIRSVINILNAAKLPGLSFEQSMAEIGRAGQRDLFDALAHECPAEPVPAAHDPFGLAAASAAGRVIQKAQQAV